MSRQSVVMVVARCANQSHYGAQQIVNIIITLVWCKCRGLSGRQWLDTRTRAAVTLITATTSSQQPAAASPTGICQIADTRPAPDNAAHMVSSLSAETRWLIHLVWL